MRPPPTRYKVVERGRRLEVIDTLTGEPVSRPSVPFPPAGGAREAEIGMAPRDWAAPASGSGASAESAGPGMFVTKGWYDDKAPRAIRVNRAARARFTNLRYGIAIVVAVLVVMGFLFWPVLVILAFLLATGPKLRAQLRAASTNWLDRLDQAARESQRG